MNVNIAILTCLKFIAVHKKLAVKFLIQFIKNQASLGSHKSAVRISVALVTDVADCLTLGIYIIHHMNEIQLIVPVIPVALGHSRIHSLQGTFHNIMHLLDLNFFFSKGSCVFLCKTADKFLLLLRKCIQNPGRRFVHGSNDLLRIELFFCSVLLNYINHTFLLLYTISGSITPNVPQHPLYVVRLNSITYTFQKGKSKNIFHSYFSTCKLPNTRFPVIISECEQNKLF